MNVACSRIKAKICKNSVALFKALGQEMLSLWPNCYQSEQYKCRKAKEHWLTKMP